MSIILTDEELAIRRYNTNINRKKMWELKKQPCADCKLLWHPMAMTFDHIDRRRINKGNSSKSISTMMWYSPSMFNRALMNMSVVCLNCHMIREMRRDQDDPKLHKHFKKEVIELLGKCSKGALLECAD